jgi:hypothetical protein
MEWSIVRQGICSNKVHNKKCLSEQDKELSVVQLYLGVHSTTVHMSALF